ncbi:RPA-interacting protein B-like [Pollicipes pollicipes]|uniref:RPA-interacting protein B-like n=1 Tax=Pollicipes pollicipes TaxID=41117 RepID=UPI0018849CB2|nr:RPA-interacting protein B-like [Pollicipes pollicipes]
MFSPSTLQSQASPESHFSSARENMRRAMYKKGTPPWRELHKQRLRERLREGRHRLLSRLRGVDATDAGGLPGAPAAASDQDLMLAEWEQLEREIIAEETERLLRECSAAEADLTLSEAAEDLLSERLACPLCQTTAADLSADLRLTCRCGLDVCTPCTDLDRVRAQLLAAVARHEAFCGEAELFFTQTAGQLIVVCAECGAQAPAFE